MPPSRCRGCCRTVKAAVEVFKAAVEVSRLLLRCGGCCEGVEAAVEKSRLLSRCGSCSGVSRLLSRREAAVVLRLLSRCDAAVEV
jgi:hypothetical protein